MVRFFVENKSAKQESDSGSDDAAPLASYRQRGSNTRAPPGHHQAPPGPTEAEYLERYLAGRNNHLKVDKKTKQLSKTKGGDQKEDMANATKTDDVNTTALLRQLNAEKKKREVLLADTKYNVLQKKLETEREEMELTKDEHRKMEAEWTKTLKTSEAEKNALIATLEAEKKMRQILEAQQIDQVSKLLLKDRMHVTQLYPKYRQLRPILSPN